MAQAGYTPISLYHSTTASAVPIAGNLVPGELAININDGKLYYENSSGVVTLFGSSGDVSTISFGSTGLTPNTATGGAVTVAGTLITSNGGTGLSSYTIGDLPYYATGTTLSKLPIGTNGQVLTSTGTAPQWSTLSGVAVTTFNGGTTGLTPNTATSGAVTLAGTLVAANGGTGQSSYTAGDLLYATGSTTLSKLGIGTNGQALVVSGGALAWGTATATTVNTLTITTSGGATAPATFNGSSAVTIDYSTVGADQAGTAVALAIALG